MFNYNKVLITSGLYFLEVALNETYTKSYNPCISPYVDSTTIQLS